MPRPVTDVGSRVENNVHAGRHGLLQGTPVLDGSNGAANPEALEILQIGLRAMQGNHLPACFAELADQVEPQKAGRSGHEGRAQRVGRPGLGVGGVVPLVHRSTLAMPGIRRRIARRRGRDSNSRWLTPCRFSRPVQSATLPPLRYGHFRRSSVIRQAASLVDSRNFMLAAKLCFGPTLKRAWSRCAGRTVAYSSYRQERTGSCSMQTMIALARRTRNVDQPAGWRRWCCGA